MPEHTVVVFDHREIMKKANEHGKNGEKKVPPEHHSEHAAMEVHPGCCARPDGNRQTFTLHKTYKDDSLMLPLPVARKKAKSKSTNTCTSCIAHSFLSNDALHPEADHVLTTYANDGLNGKPSGEIIKALEPRGRLYCTYRGKELAIGLGEYVFRISFQLEGHCFWIPTTQYRAIIAGGLVDRGEKSYAYRVPSEFTFAPQGYVGLGPLVSIQVAFVRPQWTLLFVDHNVMITFHAMRLRRVCTAADFEPGSELWLRLWSRTHGPVFSTQPQLAQDALDTWRSQICDRAFDDTPIFIAIKSTQTVFNGYGAQEGCDVLLRAFIHPGMPISLVCADNNIWSRLRLAIIEYHMEGIRRVYAKKPAYPYVSGAMAFRMNNFGHSIFLGQITCYRKQFVWASQEWLDRAHSMGLLNPDAIIQDDGNALVLSTQPIKRSHLFPSVPTEVRGKRTGIQNYVHVAYQGVSSVNMYSPFTAFAPESWRTPNQIGPLLEDVSQALNDTTLGPYSFRVFVDTTWSQENLSEDNPIFKGGARRKVSVGRLTVKRPRVSAIRASKSVKNKVGTFIVEEVKSESSLVLGELGEGVGESSGGGRVTRSRTRQGKENCKPY